MGVRERAPRCLDVRCHMIPPLPRNRHSSARITRIRIQRIWNDTSFIRRVPFRGMARSGRCFHFQPKQIDTPKPPLLIRNPTASTSLKPSAFNRGSLGLGSVPSLPPRFTPLSIPCSPCPQRKTHLWGSYLRVLRPLQGAYMARGQRIIFSYSFDQLVQSFFWILALEVKFLLISLTNS